MNQDLNVIQTYNYSKERQDRLS